MAVTRASTSPRTSRSQSPIHIACGCSAITRMRAASRGRDLAHASAWRRAGEAGSTYSRFPWNGLDWLVVGGAPSSTSTPKAAHAPARSPLEGPRRRARAGDCALIRLLRTPAPRSPAARLRRGSVPRVVVRAAGARGLHGGGELAARHAHVAHHVRLPGEQDARGAHVVVRLDH